MMNGAGWMGFGGGFMWIFWILLIVAVVLLIKAFVGPGRNESRPTDALEILRQRYARGEIDEDEFERRKQKLTS